MRKREVEEREEHVASEQEWHRCGMCRDGAPRAPLCVGGGCAGEHLLGTGAPEALGSNHKRGFWCRGLSQPGELQARGGRGQRRLFSALQPPSACSAVHRNRGSGDVLVLVDSEDDEEGKGGEETVGSSAKHEATVLVNGNSLQAAHLRCLAEGEPWCRLAAVWGGSRLPC